MMEGLDGDQQLTTAQIWIRVPRVPLDKYVMDTGAYIVEAVLCLREQ